MIKPDFYFFYFRLFVAKHLYFLYVIFPIINNGVSLFIVKCNNYAILVVLIKIGQNLFNLNGLKIQHNSCNILLQ